MPVPKAGLLKRLPDRMRAKSFHSMLVKSRKSLLIAVFSGVFLGLPLLAESPHSIHWKKIEAASGYSVEIRTEANKSTFQNTTEPTATFLLSVGKYSYRIGVYNKLKRIAKWSDWYELEVRPVKPPVINSQASDFETEGSKAKLTFSGENIYEGTSAYVIQDGKKIPAEVTTSRDRKTSVVSVDAKLVDINKDYKVVLVNPNFESIEVPLLEKESTESVTEEKKPDPKKHQTSEAKMHHPHLWSLIWRQALLPGWGHYHLGHQNTAFTYWSIVGASTLYTAFEYKQYNDLLDDLKSQRDTMSTLRVLDPDGLTLPFFAGTFFEDSIANKVSDKADTVNDALTFIGAVYVTSLVHIVYSGLNQKPEGGAKHAFNLSVRPEAPISLDRAMDMNHGRFDFKLSFYY
jgi:hypothetical protein